MNHKGDRTLAVCEADEQPTRFSLSAIWVAPEVSDEDVPVAEELLRFADGDATRAELVESLELGSSAVVIAGPNGMGKTSFFDALQWLLVGSIERLGQWASRRSADYVVNQFASSESAAVGADLLIDGQMVHVRRTGRIGETLLEWSDESGTTRGQKAEKRLAKKLLPGGGVRLKDALSTSGLLEQDFVRALLEVDPKERYRHISTLLGLF